MTEKEVNF